MTTQQDERARLLRIAREAGFITGTQDYADGVGSMPYVHSIATGNFLPELERFAALLEADAKGGEAATIAGLESATGHLSALVADLRGLMARAMANMKALHDASKPVNESRGDFDAVVPSDVFRRFVDEHAALLADLHNSPHELPATRPQQAVQVPLTDEQIFGLVDCADGSVTKFARAIEAAHGIGKDQA